MDAAQRTGRGDANVAAALTWVVPGAGHVYLGAPIFGIAAFLVVTGLYVLGIRLSGGMAFEFLQTDLRSLIAPVLTPEVGNLSAVIWHMRTYGFGPPFPRPWPEHIELGTFLTAASGVLNVCLACKAHFDARLPRGMRSTRPAPGLLVLAGWVLPGLGHWLQGRRLRGVLVFSCVAGFVALGTALAQGANLDRERHFYYWSAQFLAGSPAWILEAFWGGELVRSDLRYGDAGLAFGAVGGLLNILAWLDVYGSGEREALAHLEPAEPPAARVPA
ncbi:MAG: hypothetical protein JNK02_05025 [Planctomycetes bacterium]|nr:hypothetical protein [Planctomycetota bacterium]